MVSNFFNSEEDHVPAIIGGVMGCFIISGIFLALFSYQILQRARTKENTVKMTMVKYVNLIFVIFEA